LSVLVEGFSCLVDGSIDRQEKIMDAEDVGRRHHRIVVQGPLAAFADGLREDLAGQGFSPDTIVDHVHRLADLSRWPGEFRLDWPVRSRLGGAGPATWPGRGRPTADRSGRCWPAVIATARSAVGTTRSC
jgi:hypothetical protein